MLWLPRSNHFKTASIEANESYRPIPEKSATHVGSFSMLQKMDKTRFNFLRFRGREAHDHSGGL